MLSRQIARGARQATRATRLQSPILRSFTTGEKRPYEPINEKEVPRSSYEPGAKVQRSTRHVQEGKAAEASAIVNAVKEKIVPLTDAMYENMPPALQKMTLKGKVVIVTG